MATSKPYKRNWLVIALAQSILSHVSAVFENSGEKMELATALLLSLQPGLNLQNTRSYAGAQAGLGAQTGFRRVPEDGVMHEETVSQEIIEKDQMFIDEEKLIKDQGFPFSETELISKAKEFLYFGQGVNKPSLLAEDFVMMGPFVGGKDGLPKNDYLKAVGGFNLREAFPDFEPRFMHFRADPLDAGRVWFTSQASGTHLGMFLGNKPTGKRFETPPQAMSIKFNTDGKVVKYTIGHVMERSVGNTGGLGGVFGPAYAIGKPLPFPEARPWKPSKRYRLINFIGDMVTRMQKNRPKPKAA